MQSKNEPHKFETCDDVSLIIHGFFSSIVNYEAHWGIHKTHWSIFIKAKQTSTDNITGSWIHFRSLFSKEVFQQRCFNKQVFQVSKNKQNVRKHIFRGITNTKAG